MQIVELRASNVKALKAARIRPDGNLVVIKGKNGAGKSSVLDAIWYALGGGRALPSEPIRRGEKKAEIELDLGDLKVKRRFTEKGSTLEVTGPRGAKYPSPQRMLDEMLSGLAFDPWAFARKDAGEQRADLLKLLGIDTSALDVRYAETYDLRRAVRRDADSARQAAGVARAAAPESDPGAPVVVDEIRAEYERAKDAEAVEASALDVARRCAERVELASEKVERLEALLAETRKALEKEQDALSEARAALDALPETPDTSAILDALGRAGEQNQRVEAWARAAAADEAADEKTREVERLTDALAEIKREKEAILSFADMPIEGLELADEGLRFDGSPLDQCSAAERLRVSVAICMAADPELRIARIEDGSLLDEDSLAMLEQMAAEHDFQIWLERVGTGGDVGILIEDGEVRE